MALDPRHFIVLEQHGVSNAILEALGRIVACHENWKCIWHGKKGHLDHCEMTVFFSARPHEVQRVTQVVLRGEGVGVEPNSL